ncbi:sorting and assembly machinery component 50 [Podila minutissima]|uniref:Sorting and assembly machinery component 50 n=1 Tax=Podila minutissima TaxID=64525 RepID=A0A9P5ST11_9FUNG|nr:sorting and assembly machinery component 50 [Podila minutissima]
MKPESFDEYAKMRSQFEETAAYWKHRRDSQDYQPAIKPFDLDNTQPKNQQILGNDPIVLKEIHIQGNSTTLSAFLHTFLQPAIKAATMQASYTASKEAVVRLQRLDIFESVKMGLLPHRESSSSSSSCSSSPSPSEDDNNNNNSNNVDVDLSLVVKENKRLVFATETAVDQHGVHLAVFSKPVWSPDRILSFEIFRQTLNNMDWSSYEEDQQGTTIRYQARYVHTIHEVSYETTERDVCRLSKNASHLIRAQRGPSSKKALVHRWTLDTRDHVIAPTRGHLFRLCQELAGFSKRGSPRDAVFIKHEVESWSIAQLGAGIYLTNSFQAGYLKTLNGNPSNICDRYFLGSPISMRGIGPNDIGSHDQGDALGGDAYIAAGVNLWTQLPTQVLSSSSSSSSSNSNVKANVFGSVGAMTRVFPGQSMASTIQELRLTPTVAVGAGVAYFQPWGRLECNYTMPLVVGGAATRVDLGRGKWQFGFGIDLL